MLISNKLHAFAILLACNTAIGAGSGSRDILRQEEQQPTRDELLKKLRQKTDRRNIVASSNTYMAKQLRNNNVPNALLRERNKLDECIKDQKLRHETIDKLSKLEQTDTISTQIQKERERIKNLSKKRMDIEDVLSKIDALSKIPEGMQL